MGKPKGGPRAPPKITPHGASLSAAQRTALSEHLRTALDGAEVERLLVAVDEWLMFDAPWNCGELEDNVAYLTKRERARAERIAALARALDAELSSGLFLTRFGTTPGAALHLPLLIEDAEAAAAGPKRQRGAPRLQWRDELVALVRAHYPADKLAVAEFSHFENTVELLLRYLGVELGDLHKQVRRILRRNPEPPFTVEPT